MKLSCPNYCIQQKFFITKIENGTTKKEKPGRMAKFKISDRAGNASMFASVHQLHGCNIFVLLSVANAKIIIRGHSQRNFNAKFL